MDDPVSFANLQSAGYEGLGLVGDVLRPPISSTARTGSSDDIERRENGVVSLAMLLMRPSSRMKIISSDSGVFFIHMLTMA